MKHLLLKRAVSLVVTVAMLLTMVPAAFAANSNQFVDFPNGWSKQAMEFSVDNGLINGKSANKIEPMSNLTRAEMATIINRAFGAKITTDISSFKDVNKSDWYYTEMQKAVNMQTFQGDGNGMLRPDAAITREEVMTVIARAIVLETTDYSSISKFKDYSKVSDWAKPYVSALISNGYVNGYEDGTIRPNANVTREEFAQLMYNIFKTYFTEKGVTYNSVTNKNCVMINNESINLSNVTINGDLVLGDGVGTSMINLTNVTINGRLVARGGIITLKNVTTGKGVVVKNVNGTTHFNNYRTDAVFNGVIEHTYTTYLTPSFVTGGGRPSGSHPVVDVVYNLDLVENGGTYAYGFTEPTKYTSGKEFVLPTGSQISKTGHTFDGWYEESDFSGSKVEKIPANESGDKKYYAKWTVNEYQLTLNTNGGTISADYNGGVTDKYTYGAELVLPTDAQITKTGHIFDGWYEEADFSGSKVEKIPSDAIDGKTYYAKWIKEVYTITYVDFGGTFTQGYIPTTQYSYGDTVTFPTSQDISKQGYTFGGWYDNQEYNGPAYIGLSSNAKGNRTYYAKWVANEYQLTLNTNGGTISGDYNGGITDKYTYGAELVLPTGSQISKTGHTFDGWYEESDFSGSKVEKIPSDAIDGKAYYAKWVANEYQLTLNTNGGTISGDYNGGITDKYTYGAELVLPTDAQITKAGYTFAGWYEEADFSGSKVEKIPSDAIDSKTYYAKWILIDSSVVHTVKFYAFPQGTSREKFAGELQIADGTPFSMIIDDIKTIYRETQPGDAGTFELWDPSNPYGVTKMFEKGYFDSAEGFQHYITPDLVYYNNGKWVSFTDDTTITSDMEVYAVRRKIDLYLEGSILGISLPSFGATLKTPYNSSTRAVDSLKDALWISRESFDKVFTDEFQANLFAKLAPKSKGLIDSDGYIQNKEFSMKVADVISVDEIEDEIESYITNIFTKKKTEAETKSAIEKFIKHYVDEYKTDSLFEDFNLDTADLDTIVDVAMDLVYSDDVAKRTEFVNATISMLKAHDYYNNFIDCFEGKHDTYHIDAVDIHFALAVGEAVQDYSFDEALMILGGGSVYEMINKIGKDKFEEFYNQARDDFNNGIIEINEKINADENYSEEYMMSLKLNINFASLIDEYYTKLYDKVTKKIESVAPYYYTENPYLQEFVDGIIIDNYLDYNGTAESITNSGYKFKTIMEYYDLMYQNLLLIDKAVLWYGPNTPPEFENLRDDIANDIIKAINKLQNILENLDEDGSIFGSYTIKDVISRVESLKGLGETIPQLNTVIDNVCNILSKVEDGEVIANGYTLDDLVELSERLDTAVEMLRDEEYEQLNKELESLVDKTIAKIDEIIKELDEDGTILGKISIDDLVSKVDVIKNIYKKFEDKIDLVFKKLADIEKDSVSGKFDTEYWEDVLFGEDDYNRFDLDNIFDVVCPKLDKFRVDDPWTDSNKRLVIDEFKIKGAGATVTFDRYLD